MSVKHSFVPGFNHFCQRGIFDTLKQKALHLSDGALREGVGHRMKWKAVFVIKIFASVPPKSPC